MTNLEFGELLLKVYRCVHAILVWVLMIGVMVGLTPAHAGPAVGQFELKDLEAEPGKIEFQSQNAHAFGQPRRKVATDDDGGLIYDDNTVVRQRHALELEAALSQFFRMRVGIEYEKERTEEPDALAFANSYEDLKLDEVAVEGVIIFKRIEDRQGIGFGALVEVEKPLEKGELSSVVFGPIVEVQSGAWSAVANILLVHSFGRGEVTDEGRERDNKLDFAYATQIMYEYSPTWAFALEGYGTVDRLGDTGMPGEERAAFGDHDQHRLGPLVYYRFSAGDNELSAGVGSDMDGLEVSDSDEDEGIEGNIGVGVLFGLNNNTPDATLKWSVELEF